MNAVEPLVEISSDETPTLPSLRRGSRVRRRGMKHWGWLTADGVIVYPAYRRLSYFQEVTLIRQAQAGDIQARNTVWVANARLVYSVVNDFHVHRDLLPDAIQEGMFGLLRAIEKFDYERGNAFCTYAWHWVWQRIGRFLSQHRERLSVPAHLTQPFYQLRKELAHCVSSREINACIETWRQRIGNTLPTLLRILAIAEAGPIERSHLEIAEREPPPESPIDGPRLRADVRKALRDREHGVIVARYGLDGAPAETLQQVADKLGKTRERIRQIQLRAEERLRGPLSYWRAVLFGPEATDSPQPVGGDGRTLVPKPSNGDPSVAGADAGPSPGPKRRSAEELLRKQLQRFTPRQVQVLQLYYGLFGVEAVSLEAAAARLDITPRKAFLGLKKSRDNLSAVLARIGHPDLRELQERLRQPLPYSLSDFPAVYPANIVPSGPEYAAFTR